MAMEYSLEASQRGFIAPIVMPVFQSALAASTYPYLPLSELFAPGRYPPGSPRSLHPGRLAVEG